MQASDNAYATQSGTSGWIDAVAGCDYAHHTASAFPTVHPENSDDLIMPARDGTLRVLRAARDHGVKRVVLTSSFTAIGYRDAPQTISSLKTTGR
jgi:nucleoside-diphosphate-sugar epimerase